METRRNLTPRPLGDVRSLSAAAAELPYANYTRKWHAHIYMLHVCT